VATPPPTDSQGRLSPDFVEWMMGVSVGWTDVGLSRSARLRCLGNAVVPLQAATAYRHLLTDPERAAA
jgi:DNA (cytosine-5)-methyltransferase 1